MKLLTESLSASEGDNVDGQEYTRTLDTQGEAEALLQVGHVFFRSSVDLLKYDRRTPLLLLTAGKFSSQNVLHSQHTTPGRRKYDTPQRPSKRLQLEIRLVLWKTAKCFQSMRLCKRISRLRERGLRRGTKAELSGPSLRI